MTYKLQVKEHLRNGALYQPMTEPSLGEEWKRQLFFQHFMHRQLKAALQERKRFHKGFICIVHISDIYTRNIGLKILLWS